MAKNAKKTNYETIPVFVNDKKDGFRVVYKRKYMGSMPKSLIYKSKKSLYSRILDYLISRPITKTAIINRNEAVIIDKKYARLYEYFANKSDRLDDKFTRMANDLRYNLLNKTLFAGKLGAGLALSLLLIASDDTLVSKDLPEQKACKIEIEETPEHIVEKDDIPEELQGDILLSNALSTSHTTEEYMVYTSETLSNHLLNPESQRQFAFYLNEYAYYFNLNPDYLLDIFKEATDNYSNIDAVLDQTRYDTSNPETVAILYTYFFWRNPAKYLGIDVSEYGYQRSDFETTSERFIIEPNWMHDHVEDKSVQKEDITLRNGLAYSEYVGRMADLIGIPDEYKTYVLGVSYQERGQYGSENSIYLNNMGGLRGDNGFIAYPSPEAGIIAFIINIRRYEFDYHIDSIQDLAETYDGDEFVDTWVDNVIWHENNIRNNYERYFFTEEEESMYIEAINNLIDEDGEYAFIELVEDNSNKTPKLAYHENRIY